MPWPNCFPSISGVISIERSMGRRENTVIQDESGEKVQNLQILQQTWLLVGFPCFFFFLMFLFDEIFLEDVNSWLTYIFGEDSNLTRHAEENCGGRNTTLARRSCVRLNRCTLGGGNSAGRVQQKRKVQRDLVPHLG